MGSLVEDDIIKKRLLIEGDSGNEDRLINKLTKNFVKWVTSVQVADSKNADADDNTELLHEQMMISLSHAEFGLLRNHFIHDMNKMEQDSYKVLYDKINSEIDKAEKKIIESKLELTKAQKIRKNRQEYDVLARQIQNYPDRMEMQTTIKNLEEKLESLKRTDYEYNKKLELRRKQFSVVLQSVSSLKCLVENDCNLDMISSEVNGNSMLPVEAKDNDEDMDDEAPVSSRRNKHYTSNEVEMMETH